ncbi:MAG: hypothetical protein P4M09_12745 [Devosia sp.]|nr:hypothetical protein [Devosia sp.]
MSELESYLPLYLQMIDPSVAGPAEPEALRVFSALNSLGVIAVRPILLAAAATDNSLGGMQYILRLVVRRVVVGNLGTGNVERKLGEAARKVFDSKHWEPLLEELGDLNPPKQEFVDTLRKRSFNKGSLAFFRRSVLMGTIAPGNEGVLHFVWPRHGAPWPGMAEEEASFWAATIGNTFLSTLDRRPRGASDWAGFKELLLTTGIPEEWTQAFEETTQWDTAAIEEFGQRLAKAAGEVWYP